MTILQNSLMSLELQKLDSYQTKAEKVQARRRQRIDLETSLKRFVREAWPSIDTATYQESWAIDALCEHLEALASGQIRKLLVNFPPRCGKTLVMSICFPAWVWSQSRPSFLKGPQVKFLCGSYNHELSLSNSNLTRRLIRSPWYQGLWGSRFKFREDQNTKTKFDLSTGGSRLATSVSGSLLGVGGDIILVDDPHNTEQAESEAERAASTRWFKELSTTRLNDPRQGGIGVIMQRLHEEDVSGLILSSEWSQDWCHLCIPMHYDWRRHCVTVTGWEDPRGLREDGTSLIEINAKGEREAVDAEAEKTLDDERDGTLMWPERFDASHVDFMETELGPYMASGRLEQAPVPDKGGIFDRDWWQVWYDPNGKTPVLHYIVASLDGAFTTKEENDPSALTIWGVFFNEENEKRICLIHAWRKHLAFSGTRSERGVNETLESYFRRTARGWGLMEWVAYSCELFKVDKLLIEAKANGISAAQELQNRYWLRRWGIQLCPVKGDKLSRALAVQPTFSQLIVYAPVRDWAQMVIDEMANFPKGKYDDLVDSSTQALKYLRDVGEAQTNEEVFAAKIETVMRRPRRKALYPC
jgi:predicted phage terminase large subunit-like protein